ncbi:MAG TPA: glycosyltransferase family 39 protein [Acidimicrobiales bacterium]|nr:glycosyltransferase family 39 protein [Acidimicrobiales bacterium]
MWSTLAAAAVGNGWWIRSDHQSPPWDEANYLHIAYAWRHAFDTGGLGSWVSALYHANPAYPPLYMLLISPAEAIHPGVHAALVVNTALLLGTALGAAVTADRLFGQRSAFPAALLVAGCPLIYGLSRTPLVDILLVFLSTMAVMAAVLSDGFHDRRWAIACGLAVGLASLTKMTAPGILIPPILCCLFLPARLHLRRQATNVAGAGLTAVAVALTWYVVNLGPALTYFHSATGGALAIGTTGDPLSFAAFAAFLSLTIDSAVGAILTLTTLVAGALAVRTLCHGVHRTRVARIGVPALWFATGFLALAVSHNQDVRYLAPGIVGLGVLTAGALASVTPSIARRIILGVATGALVLQFVSYSGSFPSAGDATVSFGTTSFSIVVPFDGSSMAYTRRPGLPDYADPIVDQLARARQRLAPRGTLTVCLLTTQQVVNGNTLGFVSEVAGVPLRYADYSYVPTLSAAQLGSVIASCPVVVLQESQSSRRTASERGRVGVLNRSSAEARLRPAQLAPFTGPRVALPIGDGLDAVILSRS